MVILREFRIRYAERIDCTVSVFSHFAPVLEDPYPSPKSYFSTDISLFTNTQSNKGQTLTTLLSRKHLQKLLPVS